MSDERKSAVALIAGSLGGVLIMLVHPTGHDLLAPGQFELMARMLVGVHALALATLPVLFLGAWGLTRRIARPDRLAISALVCYAFALLAICIAAVADGLLAPVLFRKMLAAPAPHEMWDAVLYYNFRVNQSFAQLYLAACSVAIFLWSLSLLRERTFSQILGWFGVLFAPLTFLAVLSGHLRLDPHGFLALILPQTVWFVSAGLMLYRDVSPPASPQSPSVAQ